MPTRPLSPLDGVRVITTALNLPGPIAVARLRDLGAAVLKIEPSEGDPLQHGQPAWYHELHRHLEVIRLNLKTPEGRDVLGATLAGSDLLITSSRVEALDRIGLGWKTIGPKYPRLHQVAIVGADDDAEPGHDLSYQARAGLVAPPALPRTLVADLGGALEAVAAALALLMNRLDHPAGDLSRRYFEVPLTRVARYFAEPLRYGLTGPGDLLGGGSPFYNLYRTARGWIAVTALEPRFRVRLQQALGLTAADKQGLADVFAGQPAEYWETWARERDLPIARVEPIPDRVRG